MSATARSTRRPSADAGRTPPTVNPVPVTPRPPDLSSLERGPQLRARRSPRWIAAGVLAICLGGLGATLLWNEAVTSQQVLRVNAAVARGEVIEARDLGPVTVGSLPGVSVVPADQLDDLVGKQALVDLPAGSLVPAGGIGVAELAPGTVRLGLSLPAGRLPGSAMVPGEQVLLIPVPGPDQAEAEMSESPVTATLVTPPTTAPDGAARLVDVTVAAADADVVARLAATDRLVLARVG